MEFDPYNPLELNKLINTVKESTRQLEKFRDERRKLVKDFAGASYSDSSDVEEQPVNLIALMQDIYLMHMAGATPQVALVTPQRELLPFAADLEAVLNQELKDMQFDITLRKWVQEAIFSIGILKCGLVDSDYLEIIPGEPQASQEFFADIIDLDDFCFDTEATTWQKCTFLSDRYAIDYDELMENPNFDTAAKADVAVPGMDPTQDGLFNKTRDISFGQNIGMATTEKFRRRSFIRDVWIPEEGIIVTIADSSETRVPLKVTEWQGPSHGPYHLLGFTDVPGNCLPLAPAQLVRGLNKLVNHSWRKLADQGMRNKRVGVVTNDGKTDAEAIRKAQDGDVVSVESQAAMMHEMTLGGISQELMALTMQADQTFSRLAGNLDSMGGLGAQSETYRQDQLIANQVSKKSAKMTRAVVDATVKVIKDLMYYVWYDPIRVYQTTRRIEGTEIDLAVQLEPTNRQGNLENFKLEIIPYSMQYQSPQERGSSLVQLITNVVMPMMPMLQQQGVNLNMQHLMQTLSKYLNLPELQYIFEFNGIALPGTMGEQRQSPSTHRVNERISRSAGGSQQGHANQMISQLLTNSNNASQNQGVLQ